MKRHHFRGTVRRAGARWWAWEVRHIRTGELVAAGEEFTQSVALYICREAVAGAESWRMFGRKDLRKKAFR